MGRLCFLRCLCTVQGMSTTEAYALPLSLGQQMANARKRAGLTQTELGRRWSEHRNTISRWERDGGEPSFSQMVDLSTISGWPLELFARAAGTPTPGPDGGGDVQTARPGCLRGTAADAVVLTFPTRAVEQAA